MAWPFKTVTHYPRTRTTDGQGGWTEGDDTGVSIKMVIQPASATEVEGYGPSIGYVSDVGYVRKEVTLEREEEVEYLSVRYRIKAVMESTKPKYNKVPLERLQEGN